MLPRFKPIDFGNRDVEVRAQSIFQALHHVTLFFEGVGALHMNVQRQDADGWRGHWAARRYWATGCGSSAATRCMVNASITSPTCTALKFASEIPHSTPFLTSLASFLKRLRASILPVCTTSLPRFRRTWLSRRIEPSETKQPATVPTLLILNVSRTSAWPWIVSL